MSLGSPLSFEPEEDVMLPVYINFHLELSKVEESPFSVGYGTLLIGLFSHIVM
jgi:hypothetical protein